MSIIVFSNSCILEIVITGASNYGVHIILVSNSIRKRTMLSHTVCEGRIKRSKYEAIIVAFLEFDFILVY